MDKRRHYVPKYHNVVPIRDLLPALDAIGAVDVSVCRLAREAGVHRATARRWLLAEPVARRTDERIRAVLGLPGVSPRYPAKPEEAIAELASCRAAPREAGLPGDSGPWPAGGYRDRFPLPIFPWKVLSAVGARGAASLRPRGPAAGADSVPPGASVKK